MCSRKCMYNYDVCMYVCMALCSAQVSNLQHYVSMSSYKRWRSPPSLWKIRKKNVSLNCGLFATFSHYGLPFAPCLSAPCISAAFLLSK